ncbi:hypothetical protein [Enterobacter hormaechei]|uniref:hypothetical protein n=1 Tax=Enterobacter hormaechei TaxID=158836 RepID=UPI001FCEA185|nr:hypothetical protein [Enterobacter hormaechei]
MRKKIALASEGKFSKELIKAISRPQKPTDSAVDRNHRKEDMTVGIEPEWKVEKQPHGWWLQSGRQLPLCQADTLKRRRFWTKPRTHSLTAFVLVRPDLSNGLGNGAAKRCGVSYIADAFSRETDNGIHVPGAVLMMKTKRLA